MFNQINERVAKLNQQIEALRKEAAESLRPMFKEFMSAHPSIKQVKWTQYTPYFNDGDACTFRLGGVGFYFDGDDLEDSYYDHEVYGEWESDYSKEKKAKTDKTTWAACQEFKAALNHNEDALLAIFGDHAQVTLTPNGAEVDEYEHE